MDYNQIVNNISVIKFTKRFGHQFPSIKCIHNIKLQKVPISFATLKPMNGFS
jgi:hypothetical protein